MKEYSNEDLRNEMIGLGKKSVRKNHYRSLQEKKKDLEEKNKQLIDEVEKRIAAEEDLKALNEDLEVRIAERTQSLKETNDKLKKTFDELKKSQALLLEAEKISSLNHLIIGVSHELNTPIGVSLTTATYLKELLSDMDKKLKVGSSKSVLMKDIKQLKEGLNLLVEVTENSIEIVENFKQLSDVHLDHHIKYFNVYDAIQFSIRSMKHDFKLNREVDVHIDCNKDMIIETDLNLFTQLLNIFLSNSLKYAFDEQGGQIDIRVLKKSEGYHLYYKDNGRGIPKEVSDHVFEPFFTTSRSGKTSGLGLYSAYNLVNSIKGEISFETALGQGISFDVFIPVSE